MSKKDMMQGKRTPMHRSTKIYLGGVALVAVGSLIVAFSNGIVGFLVFLGGLATMRWGYKVDRRGQ